MAAEALLAHKRVHNQNYCSYGDNPLRVRSLNKGEYQNNNTQYQFTQAFTHITPPIKHREKSLINLPILMLLRAQNCKIDYNALES